MGCSNCLGRRYRRIYCIGNPSAKPIRSIAKAITTDAIVLKLIFYTPNDEYMMKI